MRMADGVDAAVERDELAAGDAVSKRRRPNSDIEKLTPGHHPVLLARQRRNPRIDVRSVICGRWGRPQITVLGHPWTLAGELRRLGSGS